MERIEFKDTVTWINIENVTKEDTEYLREEFEFHPLDLTDCLGASQRPKVDIYDDYFFLVLHFSVIDKEKNVIRTSDLNIFLTGTRLITIQKKPIAALADLFNDLNENTSNKAQIFQGSTELLLYYILDKLYHRTLSTIDDLSGHVGEIEEHIFANKARHAVKQLAIARRNNLNMRAIVNPQRLVINTLAHMQKDWFNKDGEVTLYYDDVLDYLEKNWVLLENQKELIDGLNQTNESLISYKTNAIITMLTIFSVGILPFTVLTGFYGMNIALPHQDDPQAIGIIFLIVGLVTALIIYVVMKKKWI